MLKAQIGDVMIVNVREPRPQTHRLTLQTQAAADYANQLLNDPSSGWELEKAASPSPALRAYDEAMQAAGVPREPLDVYTSNSWRRVGLARTYSAVMAPTVARDGQPDIQGTAVLYALVAAFNAMLELRASALKEG